MSEYNIPFRQSHEIVGTLVKDSTSFDNLLDIDKLEKLVSDITCNEVRISEKIFQDAANLEDWVNRRISIGSPSKFEVEKYIRILLNQKNMLFDKYIERIGSLEEASMNMERLIQKYTK